jgi:hypothetical protein
MEIDRERGGLYRSGIGSNKAFNDEGNNVFNTPDGVTLYTQEDIDSLNTRINEQFKAGVDYATRAVTNSLQDKAINWFRSEVRNGSMAQDDALGIYNGLAEALGWDTLDSLTIKYTVSVMFQGNTVAEFEDVEAEDSSSAEDEVRGNLEVEDVEINFVLSYNGNTARESANITWDFDEEFEFEAVEQD